MCVYVFFFCILKVNEMYIIEQFKINLMPKYCNVLMFGKPECGKTYLCCYLIKESMPLYKLCNVYSRAPGGRETYSRIIPSTFVHETLDPVVQVDRMENHKKYQKQYPNGIGIINVYDDIENTEGGRHSSSFINDIVRRCRHFNFFNLIATQHVSDYQPSIRACADFLFVFRNLSRNTLQQVYHYFVNNSITYSMFEQCYQTVIEYHKYAILVIDKKQNPMKLYFFIAGNIDWSLPAVPIDSILWKYHFLRTGGRDNAQNRHFYGHLYDKFPDDVI